jgi:hypothetical protein
VPGGRSLAHVQPGSVAGRLGIQAGSTLVKVTPPPLGTNRTRRVLLPVLIRHAVVKVNGGAVAGRALPALVAEMAGGEELSLAILRAHTGGKLTGFNVVMKTADIAPAAAAAAAGRAGAADSHPASPAASRLGVGSLAALAHQNGSKGASQGAAAGSTRGDAQPGDAAPGAALGAAEAGEAGEAAAGREEPGGRGGSGAATPKDGGGSAGLSAGPAATSTKDAAEGGRSRAIETPDETLDETPLGQDARPQRWSVYTPPAAGAGHRLWEGGGGGAALPKEDLAVASAVGGAARGPDSGRSSGGGAGAGSEIAGGKATEGVAAAVGE